MTSRLRAFALVLLSTAGAALSSTPSPALSSTPASPAAAAPRDEFEKALTASRRKLAVELVAVARWCDRKKWLLERDRIYERILTLDEDHAEARKVLGYESQRGEWVRSRITPVRNHSAVEQDELDDRERKATEADVERRLEAIDRFKGEVEEERIQAELAALLKEHPSSGEVRKRAGYVPGWDGRPWVTPLAKQSKERRSELRELGRRLRAAAPKPTDSQVRDSERALGIAWVWAQENPRGRAITSVEREELGPVLEVAWAVTDLFHELFKTDDKLPDGMTIHLCMNKQEGDKIGRAWPDTPVDREIFGRVTSVWIDWVNLGAWNEDTVARLDSVTRQMVGRLLRPYGISPEHGWVWEGFGVYLSHMLTGTRRSFFFVESDYDDGPKMTKRLEEPGANWYQLGYEVMTAPRAPNLIFLLGKDVNQLGPEELLASHALAAYLLETKLDKVPDLLRRIGEGQPPAKVVEDAVGMPMAKLQQALVEWLDDVRF